MMKRILLLLLLCLLSSGCVNSTKDKPFTVRMLGKEEPGEEFEKTLSLFSKDQQYWILAFVKTYPVDISQLANWMQDFNKTNQERTIDNFFEYIIEVNEEEFRQGEEVCTKPTVRKLFILVKENYNLIKQLD